MGEYKKKKTATFTNKDGERITFNIEWGGHTFTKRQIELLKRGDQVTLRDMVSKSGIKYTAKGGLQEQNFNGTIFWGFKMWDYIPEEEETKKSEEIDEVDEVEELDSDEDEDEDDDYYDED